MVTDATLKAVAPDPNCVVAGPASSDTVVPVPGANSAMAHVKRWLPPVFAVTVTVFATLECVTGAQNKKQQSV